MSEVFISYARPQEPEAGRIAQALRTLGFGVWRDDELPAHRDYSEVIEERLRSAKAVVVVWSAEAIRSQWVRAEADIARQAGTLVQLSLDGATPPLPFNRIQCADLRGWQGEETAAGWRKVADSVAELVGRAPAEAAPTAAALPTVPAPAAPLAAAPIPAPTPDRLTLAVTPLADPAGAAAGDDFAEGLASEIATALARFSTLQVADAGAARYRLDGAVRRYGERVRISLRLIEAAGGEQVWAERFDDSLADPFALQDNVAARAACRIESAILAHETRRIAGRPVESLSANQLWLLARETIRRAGLAQVDEIESLSARALAQDAGHGRALSLLAAALGFRIAYAGAGADTADLQARFAEATRAAMVAGADDAEVMVFVAEAHLLADKDLVVARALADRALQMNAGLAVAWDISANIRMQAGEYGEALARYERCLSLEPQTPWRTYVWPSMAGCLIALGRPEEAIVLAKEGLQISPDNPWAAAFLVAALTHTGRLEEARAALAQLDPRQAGLFRTTTFGPGLAKIIDEALTRLGWTPAG